MNKTPTRVEKRLGRQYSGHGCSYFPLIGHEGVRYNERVRRNIFVYFVVVCFYLEYEKESTNILAIIGGVIGGAALLLGVLAALLLFKRKQKIPLSGNERKRAMSHFPLSHSSNIVAHG